MTWDDYATSHPHNENAYLGEPVQQARAKAIVRRAYGRVLDVGGGDGYIASLMAEAGCQVTVVDISKRRVLRARHEGHQADVGDASKLPYPDNSFDCVVLGEVLEHLVTPGQALREAFRVSRDRVITSFPLNGWEDPTHRWRIAMDVIEDPAQRQAEPTKGQQVVVTWEPGVCWPAGYWKDDVRWEQMFEVGR